LHGKAEPLDPEPPEAVDEFELALDCPSELLDDWLDAGELATELAPLEDCAELAAELDESGATEDCEELDDGACD